MGSPALSFQQLSTVQSPVQQQPLTITAAATIAPQTFLTIVSGTVAIATITPPIQGSHMLAIVATSTNFSGFVTTGNILVASLTNSTVWANKLSLFVYNPITGKYHPRYAVTSTNAE
jgi:hypothetical protein